MRLASIFQNEPTPTATLARQRRERALETARKTLPELRREDLKPLPFGFFEHDGERYKVVRGLVDDPSASAAHAFYLAETGDAVYLESAGGRARIKAGA
ncbi:hypothetical protein [Gaiella sp.]|jgi:hypothetical protein|uniref:hypothetical protein n=1 Tax=Gaiella sp. TaxID=2663207 RepID=UPI002E351B05|nr:hypothetical protein [Gaiella sp.]HEX5585416.1 hypothetical protein [Gaiella sp.]